MLSWVRLTGKPNSHSLSAAQFTCRLHKDISPLLSQRNSPPVGQGLLIIDDSQSHSDTPQSVGLLWTSDQPVAETSTWQHTTLITDIHAICRIRTRNPSKWAAAHPRLRPRDHWHWYWYWYWHMKLTSSTALYSFAVSTLANKSQSKQCSR